MRDGGTFLKNRQNTSFWILFRVKLVNVALYSNITTVLGLNIISWRIKLVFHHILHLRDGGTFLRNHGNKACSNKIMNFLSLFFLLKYLFLQRSILHKNFNILSIIPSAKMKNMTLRWWDIYACPTLFLTKKFKKKKK